ncbi:MAG: metallophosphoesterase [Lentisphaeria bacterium]|nr:metallophosphoesterase [Lentisphaeria bacterium]
MTAKKFIISTFFERKIEGYQHAGKILFVFLFLFMICTKIFAAELPLFQVGIMTDTHIRNDRASCRRCRCAFEIFKTAGVDLIVNLGDIAERHSPEGYRHYRDICNEVFSDSRKKPRNLIVYANHDQLGIGNWEEACRLLKKRISASNDPYDQLEIKGFPILIFPEFMDPERYRKTIEAAVKKYPDRPIIIFDHPPACDTTDGSAFWGCKTRRRILNQFPSVIHISGHTHGSLQNERKIWQGDFTAVNAGCLSSWKGKLIGCAPESKENAGVLIMQVFPSKILFRRYDAETRQEYRPDKPWTVPLPFKKENAPYRLAVRKNGAPGFPENAGLQLSTEQWKANKLLLKFSAANHPDRTYCYRFEIEEQDGGNQWRKIAVTERFGDFYLPEKQQKSRMTYTVSTAYFRSGKKYRISVFPINFYGETGSPLIAELRVPSLPQDWETVFESHDPMNECPFYTGLHGKTKNARKNDFYQRTSWIHRLIFPDHVWNAPNGTEYRFIIDVRTRGVWQMVLRQMKPKFYPCGRLYLQSEEKFSQRCIMEFTQQDNHNYCLQVSGIDNAEIRFEYLRIERKKNRAEDSVPKTL